MREDWPIVVVIQGARPGSVVLGGRTAPTRLERLDEPVRARLDLALALAGPVEVRPSASAHSDGSLGHNGKSQARERWSVIPSAQREESVSHRHASLRMGAVVRHARDLPTH